MSGHMASLGRIKASDLMKDCEMTIDVVVIHDWRFRLGLWAMKLGARIMSSTLKANDAWPQAQADSPQDTRGGAAVQDQPQ